MLKWIKVRQDSGSQSGTTSTLTNQSNSNGNDLCTDKNTNFANVSKAEEEEDSGMEREDSPQALDLKDLKKVSRW